METTNNDKTQFDLDHQILQLLTEKKKMYRYIFGHIYLLCLKSWNFREQSIWTCLQINVFLMINIV